MLPKPLRFLWGNLTGNEVKKFGILAITFFLIIGTYWMLRVTKNAMFDVLVGYKTYQPIAKVFSLFFVGIAVLIYSKLLDIFSKQVLFYLVLGFYGIGFILFSLMFAFSLRNPDYSLIGPESPLYLMVSWIPGKFLGWFGYIFLESFGSIVPALFWSLVASTTTAASAKRGYGMVVSITQLGTILGPTLVRNFSTSWGVPAFYAIGGIIVCLIPMLIYLYGKVIPAEMVEEDKKPEKKSGFFEGLRLLVSHSYLLGVLVVVTMYEVISTIVEYQMMTFATDIYPKTDNGAALARFVAMSGQAVGVLSLTFALLGTSFFMRKFGLTFCLVAFPLIIGLTIGVDFVLYLLGASSYQLMWAFFGSIVVFKGLCYALNNPSKEVMYIPTSRDVKFKAKGWIDAFGNRSAKALGASFTNWLKASQQILLVAGTFVSLALVGFWAFVALFVGNKFNKLQKEDKIIE